MGGLLLCVLLAAGVHAQETPAPFAELAEPSEFIGYVSRELKVYAKASDQSAVLGTLPADVDIEVYNKGRVYTLVGYVGLKGYALTKHVERVQRRDPFGGLMPGVVPQVAVARLRHDASFLPEGYRYAIQLTAGTLITVQDFQKGRLTFPYRREPGVMSLPLETVCDMEFIIPWEEAEPGQLIGAFSTYYSISTKNVLNVGRVYNIKLAVQRLNGQRVEPGEVFSFNAVCAPYSEGNGYRKAPILSADDSKVGFGGGTCQVCTTLYNVVLRVPAHIVDMHWHGQGGVKYIPAGFDATVGSKWDMCFENVLPYAIEIRYETQDGVMTAMFYRAVEAS